MRRQNETKPELLIGSPPCTMFSRQQLNIHVHGPEWKVECDVERVKAVEHIRFCINLFRLQRARGKYFLLDHPESADSSHHPKIVELTKTEGVQVIAVDKCMYGLRTRGASEGKQLPANNPTQPISHSWCMFDGIPDSMRRRTCPPTFDGRPRGKAVEYSDGVCAQRYAVD